MIFPRNWLKRLTPVTLRVMTTTGANSPPSLLLPAVTRSTPRPVTPRRGCCDGPAAAPTRLPAELEDLKPRPVAGAPRVMAMADMVVGGGVVAWQAAQRTTVWRRRGNGFDGAPQRQPHK